MAQVTHKNKKPPAAAPAPMLLNKLAKSAAPDAANAPNSPDKFKGNESAVLAAIVQSSGDAIIGKTLDGIIMAWNDGAQRIFGYTPDEAIGKHISLIIPEDRLHEDDLILQKLKRGERVENYETQRLRKDSSLVDMSLTVSPVKTAAGIICGSASIAHDITRRKQAQAIMEREERVQALLKQLEEQKAALERSNEELQRFAYVAAHDLKEPLRTIISYTNLIGEENKGKLSAESEENLCFVVDAAKRLQHLISDLLAYSRVETQAKPFAPVNCEDILDLTIATLRADIDEANAQICREKLPTIYADSTQLEQLFLNLLGNALKFRGSEPPQIHVSAKPDNGNWVFCIKDNGIGLDMKFAERIFQMFQRLHSMSEYPGTGIGLAICKKIVEKHKGYIWVESEPGHGTAFFFSLSAAAAVSTEPEDIIAAIART
jgi:PAS domain S-box-containing protein